MKINILSISILLLSAYSFISCKDTRPVKEATEAKQNVEIVKTGTIYNIESNSGKILWEGRNPANTHKGIITFLPSKLFVENGELKSGEFIADMNSIKQIDDKNNVESDSKLVQHLKSNDFFDVEKFPTAKFVITSIKKINDKDFNTEISGNFSIKDKKKNITIKANVKVEDEKISIETEDFGINRHDFELHYSDNESIKDRIIDARIGLKVIVEAKK